MKDTVVSEILRTVATRLTSYKVPETLETLDELPRNALSKVDRNRLQAMATEAGKAGRLRIGAAASQPKQPDERVRRVARNR
jgi:acyl-coenzyme A synthetase/AMP-(fatty) acid ligase